MTTKSPSPTGPKKKPRAGSAQAGPKPKKLLNNGLDPSIGKDTQWKPGESGNPAGMKPGTKHINTWMQEIVTDPEFEARIIDPKLGYIEYKGAPLIAIIKSLAHISLTHPDHDVRLKAMDKIFKYGWPTKNEVSGPDGERLQVVPLVVSDIAPRDHDAPAEGQAS